MSRTDAPAALHRVRLAVSSTIVGILLSSGLGSCVVDGDVLVPPGGEGGGQGVAALVTLYAEDPLRHTLDFESGAYGTVLAEGGIRNRNSHLDFDFYLDDGLTVGIQGGERGAIVDLGAEAELPRPNGESAFASLELSGSAFSIPAADVVFDDAQSNQAPVTIGHVYVARVDRGDAGTIVAKWIVADHVPGRSVVLDWVRLR